VCDDQTWSNPKGEPPGPTKLQGTGLEIPVRRLFHWRGESLDLLFKSVNVLDFIDE